MAGSWPAGAGDDYNDEPGEVLLWDLSTRKLVKTLTRNDLTCYKVAISPSGKLVASEHGEKVKLWSVDGSQVEQNQFTH